ncbi:hypothetical protein B0H14DRAFT_3871834 [Mycena olivaceomarginata]|nr:hypothetical protein B0H14DRAFT_3871834 [Mycena olivaceomarginata]
MLLHSAGLGVKARITMLNRQHPRICAILWNSKAHLPTGTYLRPRHRSTIQLYREPPTRETTASAVARGTSGAAPRNPLSGTQFGLKKGEQFESMQRPPTDYRRKYAEDPPYKELDSEARVWHVYNDESQIFDDDMMIESGDNLDILLVFAGLFSSVLTTFVAQTSQALSTDNTAVSNSILLELVALQRALANGTSLESIPSANTSFTVALSDVWVNGLWFTSLTLSLTMALLAVLAKQWLRQYSSFIAGSARERALIRQFRYACFNKWGVQFIIGFLPVILHLSLGLFMAGLVVFLSVLNHTIAMVPLDVPIAPH